MRRSDRARGRRGFSALGAAFASIVVLTGCIGSADTGTPPLDEGAGGNPFVQDLWVFDELRTLDEQGRVIEHGQAIVDHLTSADSSEDPVELIPGSTFHPVGQIGAHLTGADGRQRADASAVLGWLENEVGTTFAVLGSVDADGGAPIGPDDRLFFDMEFVGGGIAVGDLVSADYTLVQLAPTGDPVETAMDALGLAAHRAAAESLFYTADEDGDVVVLTHELGRIVEGSTGPSLPAKSQDMTDGLKKGKVKCAVRGGGLGCVAQHFKNFGNGALDSWNQAWRNALPDPPSPPEWRPPPPTPPPLPPERPRPPCAEPPCGKSTGDPHLTTLDGHRYGMQAVGEFVLARHDADDVEIQVRTTAVNDHVSWVQRVAVDIGGERILMGLDDVVIDGQAYSLTDAPRSLDGPGYDVSHTGRVTVVGTDSGHSIWVSRGVRSTINIVLAAAEADGGWVGLLGDADGDPTDDHRTRGGERVELDPGFDELYQELVASWRVTDEESLLDYGPGESSSTFTDLSLPVAPFTVDDLDPRDRAHAEAACGLAGIVSVSAFEECVLDFALTGAIDTLRSARLSDVVDGVLSGSSDAYGSPLDAGWGENPEAMDAWRTGGESLLGVHATEGSVVHECPAANPETLRASTVYGDGIYSPDSSVCHAAVHDGVLTVAEGGVIEVIAAVPAAEGYPATSRNGVDARALRAGYPWGFRIALAE